MRQSNHNCRQLLNQQLRTLLRTICEKARKRTRGKLFAPPPAAPFTVMSPPASAQIGMKPINGKSAKSSPSESSNVSNFLHVSSMVKRGVLEMKAHRSALRCRYLFRPTTATTTFQATTFKLQLPFRFLFWRRLLWSTQATLTGVQVLYRKGAGQAASMLVVVHTLDDESVLPHILGAQLHRYVPCNTGPIQNDVRPIAVPSLSWGNQPL
jgi:hypothetical protein